MARASNIGRRGNSWIVYFRVNGRQHMRSFADGTYGGTAAAKEAAKLYLAQSQTKKIRGEFHAPTKIRFADFAAEWLREYARAHVGPRTYEGYENVLRVHLVPELGDLYLSQITRKALDALVADWSAGGPRFKERIRLANELEQKRAKGEGRPARAVRLGNSPKTIGNAIVPLREMLSHAVDWGYLTANPAIGVRRPRVERSHDEMRVLDAAAVRKLLDAAPKETKTLLLCAVTTGMRRGELLGLRWGDVDWTANRIWVRRSVGNGGAFLQPKSRRSVRAIAMTSTLASALKLHRMASLFKDADQLIFPSERGTPLEGRNVARRFLDPALRKAGLASMRFHDLRHTYASLLIAQGAHPKLISEQLGHASTQITLDRYGHLMDQSYGDASAQLEAALFGGDAVAAASVSQALGVRAVPDRAAVAQSAVPVSA
jgi:integrase